MNQGSTRNGVRLSALFGSNEVICGAQDLGEERIVRALIERIGQTGELQDVAQACSALIAGSCCSVACTIPETAIYHARMQGMKSLRIAFATQATGIECRWFKGSAQRVRLLVLVLAPPDEPAGYLRARAALTGLCGRQGFLDRACSLVDPQHFWEYVHEADERLPEYVRAGDIMETGLHRLRDTDALSAAVDAFCELSVSELPVVDGDGDLVGVVSNEELMRVCLPEYITWMEDLSPILDFQPFAEMIRQEKAMPVVEIMMFADRYATLEEAAPAVQAAKVMMRRDLRRVWVVRDGRLVGVISVQDFVRKVLRA